MAAQLRPWLIGFAVLIVLVIGVLIVLALVGVFHDMQQLGHLAGQANKGD